MSPRPSLLEEVKRTPPQPPQDNAVSPAEVGHKLFEAQVKEAESCMQCCREMIDKLEDILEVSQPDTQAGIR